MSKKESFENQLKQLNLLLSLILLALALYIIFFPYSPNIRLFIDKNIGLDHSDGHVYKSFLAKEQGVKEENLKPMPKDNILIIPKIRVDSQILEGERSGTMERGIWRRPNTSTPDKGGNTVIVAHRFLYTSGAKTFYHLDKVEKGDVFTIFWGGEEYTYRVFETMIVKPTDIKIEENTHEAIVTLYTCTPLWTAENRLVVRARLLHSSKDYKNTNKN